MKFVVNDGSVETGILLNLMASFYGFACMVSKKVKIDFPNELFWEVHISKGVVGEGNYRAWVTVSVVRPIHTKSLYGPKHENQSVVPIHQCSNIEIHLDGSVSWNAHQPMLMEKLNSNHPIITTLIEGLKK